LFWRFCNYPEGNAGGWGIDFSLIPIGE